MEPEVEVETESEEESIPIIIREPKSEDEQNSPKAEESEKENSSGSDSNSDSETYEVEKILDHRVDSMGRRRFWLKWKGYDYSENTWEKEEDLDCPELIAEYEQKYQALLKATTSKGKMIEKPHKVLDAYRQNGIVFYTVLYKSGKRANLTSSELCKIHPSIAIRFLEKISNYPERT